MGLCQLSSLEVTLSLQELPGVSFQLKNCCCTACLFIEWWYQKVYRTVTWSAWEATWCNYRQSVLPCSWLFLRLIGITQQPEQHQPNQQPLLPQQKLPWELHGERQRLQQSVRRSWTCNLRLGLVFSQCQRKLESVPNSKLKNFNALLARVPEHKACLCAQHNDPAGMLACLGQWFRQKLSSLRLTKSVLPISSLPCFQAMPLVSPASWGCCTAGLLCEGIMHRAESRCGRNITWLMEFEQVPMVQASDEDQELADSFAWRYS